MLVSLALDLATAGRCSILDGEDAKNFDGGDIVKTLVAGAAALLLLGAAPALAMSCCGGAKGKAGLCAKGDMKGSMKSGMSMSRADSKGGKGCCCEGMAGKMSRRS
jgi:hypothetical protein